MPLERFRCRGLLYLDEPTRLLGEYRILLTCLFPGCARCSIPTRVWSRLLNWASRFEFGKPARIVTDIVARVVRGWSSTRG